jgi:hypothetical protein
MLLRIRDLHTADAVMEVVTTPSLLVRHGPQMATLHPLGRDDLSGSALSTPPNSDVLDGLLAAVGPPPPPPLIFHRRHQERRKRTEPTKLAHLLFTRFHNRT